MNYNIARYLIAKSLGYESTNREVIQAKLYLAQYLGIPLYLRFIWWYGHPICKDLSKNNLNVDYSLKINNVVLKNNIKIILDKVNCLESYKPSDMTLSRWYEMLAGITYILGNKESWHWNEENYLDLLLSETKETEAHIYKGINILKQEHFL